MGMQVIEQPDGLLCVFSTNEDCLVIVDATNEEVIDYFTQMAADEARERVTRLLGKVRDPEARPYFQFTLSYDEAVALDAETADDAAAP